MSRSICFLLDAQAEPQNDNDERLPRAFKSAGWEVVLCDQGHLGLEGGEVCARSGEKSLALDEFTLIWHLGLGSKRSFLDRMELLSILPIRSFTTPPQALALQHGKLHLLDHSLRDMLPETLASGDPDYLTSSLDRGEWVIKPAAGSFGRGVIRTSGDSPELGFLLREACDGGLLIAQRYVPCEDGPEIRVLFAEGQAIGSYGRVAKHGSPANLARGAAATEAHIGPSLAARVDRVGDWLVRQGVGFAAADFRDNHLIEINIANPGGLATLEGLAGDDLSSKVVERLAARHG